MAKKYDINDPFDREIMDARFDMITMDEWDEYIEKAERLELGYKNINILRSASKKAGISKYTSPKMLSWVMSLVDQLDETEEEEEK